MERGKSDLRSLSVVVLVFRGSRTGGAPDLPSCLRRHEAVLRGGVPACHERARWVLLLQLLVMLLLRPELHSVLCLIQEVCRLWPTWSTWTT